MLNSIVANMLTFGPNSRFKIAIHSSNKFDDGMLTDMSRLLIELQPLNAATNPKRYFDRIWLQTDECSLLR